VGRSLAIMRPLRRLNGYIAMRGVNGSTMTALVINVIQLTRSSCSAASRFTTAEQSRARDRVGVQRWVDVVMPHSAHGRPHPVDARILILVGFESCTAFAAETKDPKKNIPRR